MLLIRSLIFIGLLELDLCLARHFHALSRPHRDRSSLEKGSVREERSSLSKRSSFTYFATGLGACGETTTDSDYIVAISAQDWDSGAHCFASITITVDGKSASASIVDECMGCASGDLDFSQGLFEYFADTSVGVLSGSWSYSSGSDSSGDTAETTSTTQWQEPTTTSTYVYVAPTTTSTSSTPEWTPTTTSSTSVYTPPPSTSSSTYTPSSSSVYSSSSVSSTAPSSSVSAPSSSSVSSSSLTSSDSVSSEATATGIMGQLDTVMIQYANMIIAAQNATDE